MVISVVIPAFNEESYLPTTLASLRDAISVCCCGVELIVVDNESSDRTREVARSFGASPRRFDLTPTWRTLIWTNPVFIALFRRGVRPGHHGTSKLPVSTCSWNAKRIPADLTTLHPTSSQPSASHASGSSSTENSSREG